jgi:hypothetical protein
MSVLKKEIQSIRFKIEQMFKTESNYYLKTVTRCDSVWEPCTDMRNVFSEKKIENLSEKFDGGTNRSKVRDRPKNVDYVRLVLTKNFQKLEHLK